MYAESQQILRPARVFAFGGGIQSTAALVLAAQKKIDYNIFLFANVGDDSESPDTLEYVRTVAKPFARQHGLHLIELQRSGETLFQKISRPGNTFSGIPMRFNSGKPARRACTADFKVFVLDYWLRYYCYGYSGIQEQLDYERAMLRRGMAIARNRHIRVTRESLLQAMLRLGQTIRPLAITGMGISLDEIHRARTLDPSHWKALDYPLLDLHLTRDHCVEIIQQSGLPIPPKSACWFCPYRSLQSWRALREDHPALFEKAAAFEDRFNVGRRSKMWLTRKMIPLKLAVQQGLQQPQSQEDTMDMCESGHCGT